MLIASVGLLISPLLAETAKRTNIRDDGLYLPRGAEQPALRQEDNHAVAVGELYERLVRKHKPDVNLSRVEGDKLLSDIAARIDDSVKPSQ